MTARRSSAHRQLGISIIIERGEGEGRTGGRASERAGGGGEEQPKKISCECWLRLAVGFTRTIDSQGRNVTVPCVADVGDLDLRDSCRAGVGSRPRSATHLASSGPATPVRSISCIIWPMIRSGMPCIGYRESIDRGRRMQSGSNLNRKVIKSLRKLPMSRSKKHLPS